MENDTNYLVHYGTKGMQWGKRRYQNTDGSLTTLGKLHYGLTGSGRSDIQGKVTSTGNLLNKAKNNLSSTSGTSKYYSNRRKVYANAKNDSTYAQNALSSYDDSKLVKAAEKVAGTSRKLKRAIDINKDGNVDSSDLKGIAKTAYVRGKIAYNKTANKVKNKVTSALDYNDDGTLNRKDISDAVDSVKNKLKNSNAYNKVKNKLDYNNDGTVDKKDASDLYGTAKEKAAKTYGNVKAKLTKTYGIVAEDLSEAYKKTKKYIADKVKDIKSGKAEVSELKSVASEWVNNAKEAVSSIVGKTDTKKADSWIEKTINAIGDTIDETVDKVEDYVDDKKKERARNKTIKENNDRWADIG